MSSLELDSSVSNSSLMQINLIQCNASVANMILESLFHFDFYKVRKMKIKWILALFICTETKLLWVQIC
jgi:hypothetical protein